jgi:predicted component of type VI protein secretion system
MEAKLIVIGGKRPGQAIPVRGPKFFIGRAEDCHLRPNSEMVSRRHCAILMEEGLVAVRDFGSKNGTFVNGQQVKAERELKAGDKLKVGPLEFEVQLTVSVSGQKKPKVRSVQEAAIRTVQSAAADDLDISQWLEDDEDDDTAADSESHDTVGLPSGAVARADAGHPGVSPPPHDEEYGVESVAKLIGGLEPEAPKPTAQNSRAAAADMLKQLYGGT